MGKSASAIVLAGNGTNCENETAHACKLGGFDRVDIVSIWELVQGEKSLEGYQLLCLPGGFLDGDDLGSAKAQANRFLHTTVAKTGKSLFSQFESFINAGNLVLGICNGFQLMVKLGLLPGLDGRYSQQKVTLTHNDSGKFEDRWVWLKANQASPCVFTKGMDTVYFPVRHGEGKFIAENNATLQRLVDAQQVVFSYIDPLNHTPTMNYPANPNGSESAIAGICDPSGRVFGLMPHPEAYLFRTNHPRWTRENLPEEGAGVALFRNAYSYITQS